MTSKVLAVGTPSEEVRNALSGGFGVQILANPAEMLSREQLADCGVVFCCLAELSQAFRFLHSLSASFPKLPVVWLLPSTSVLDRNEIAAFAHIEILPHSASAQFISMSIEKAISRASIHEQQTLLFERSIDGSVAALFEVLSIVEPYSASLGQRLRYAVDLFGKASSSDLSWSLETAALLAEIGVLTIPVRILLKNQSGQELSGFEQDLLNHVPERGADLLEQVPSFRDAAKILRYQNKNYDGTGFPHDNLAGDKIPFGSRVLKVISDLFKLKEGGLDHQEAIAEMRSRRGRYDFEILEIANECFKENIPSQVLGSTLPLTLKELRPGQMLVSSVETDDGMLVIKDGQVISARLLHKLRNFAFTSGIKEPIYVIDLLESPKMATTFHEMAHSETSFFARAQGSTASTIAAHR